MLMKKQGRALLFTCYSCTKLQRHICINGKNIYIFGYFVIHAYIMLWAKKYWFFWGIIELISLQNNLFNLKKHTIENYYKQLKGELFQIFLIEISK